MMASLMTTENEILTAIASMDHGGEEEEEKEVEEEEERMEGRGSDQTKRDKEEKSLDPQVSSNANSSNNDLSHPHSTATHKTGLRSAWDETPTKTAHEEEEEEATRIRRGGLLALDGREDGEEEKEEAEGGKEGSKKGVQSLFDRVYNDFSIGGEEMMGGEGKKQIEAEKEAMKRNKTAKKRKGESKNEKEEEEEEEEVSKRSMQNVAAANATSAHVASSSSSSFPTSSPLHSPPFMTNTLRPSNQVPQLPLPPQSLPFATVVQLSMSPNDSNLAPQSSFPSMDMLVEIPTTARAAVNNSRSGGGDINGDMKKAMATASGPTNGTTAATSNGQNNNASTNFFESVSSSLRSSFRWISTPPAPPATDLLLSAAAPDVILSSMINNNNNSNSNSNSSSSGGGGGGEGGLLSGAQSVGVTFPSPTTPSPFFTSQGQSQLAKRTDGGAGGNGGGGSGSNDGQGDVVHFNQHRRRSSSNHENLNGQSRISSSHGGLGSGSGSGLRLSIQGSQSSANFGSNGNHHLGGAGSLVPRTSTAGLVASDGIEDDDDVMRMPHIGRDEGRQLPLDRDPNAPSLRGHKLSAPTLTDVKYLLGRWGDRWEESKAEDAEEERRREAIKKLQRKKRREQKKALELQKEQEQIRLIMSGQLPAAFASDPYAPPLPPNNNNNDDASTSIATSLSNPDPATLAKNGPAARGGGGGRDRCCPMYGMQWNERRNELQNMRRR